jgi:tripartite-type tricarboxylate transporter receptor subunit TctC
VEGALTCVPRIASESAAAMNAPGTRETLLKFSQYPDVRSPAQFANQIQADHARYRALIQSLGIKVE